MKYTVQVQGGEKLVVEKHVGESQRHILQKLLAYLLFADWQPRIELKVWDDKRDYRPDVVAFEESGEIMLWVDCGQIAVKKVDDLTRRLPHAQIVIVKIDRHELEGYAREAAKKVKRIERVEFLAFDNGFLARLADELVHLNTVKLERDGANLVLTWNGAEFSSTLYRWDRSSQRAVPALPADL
jgi:uncharacterized protein YaeQ